MALADRIRDLEDRIQADLRAAHDYYAHTMGVWKWIFKSPTSAKAGY
jgi:hypothetical protein